MPIFGQVLSNEEDALDVRIPDAYNLYLSNVTLGESGDGNDSNDEVGDGSIYIYLQTDTEDKDDQTDPYVICRLNEKKAIYQVNGLNLKLGPEDGLIKLYKKGKGVVHVTGSWEFEYDDDDDDGDDGSDEDDHECDEHCNHSDEDDDEEEEEEEEEEVEEIPTLVPLPTAAPSKASKRNHGETLKKESSGSSSSSSSSKPNKKSKSQADDIKVLDANSSSSNILQDIRSIPARKKWKVKVLDGEGIEVPEPKVIFRNDVLIKDFIIGKGVIPTNGSKVKINYEGSLVDGTVFDERLKTNKPFVFRKATGQVIKGLDIGIDDMRIGGAREITIPYQLGYGNDGVDAIPPKAHLIFRVRLLGQEKR